MLSMHLMGVLSAILSAAVWGSGDFCGGLATRRSRPFQVVTLTAVSGAASMALLAWLLSEPWPSPVGMAWAVAAGILGGLGIAALYRGLSQGEASVVAPTAAVVGAVGPVLAGAVLEGLPDAAQAIGLLLGLGGIWLVSGASLDSRQKPRAGFGMAVLAGLAFGGFFVAIAQVDDGLIFTPLVLAKLASLGIAVSMLAMQRLRLPAQGVFPIALLAGVLDAGGNVFYILARQYTRLDVAAVLSSMYPASTVILATLVLHQKVNREQWVGISLCLCALALIVI
jgi:uncharacterized membrane protein